MLNKLGIQETLVAENEQDYQTAKILFKHKYQNLPFEVASSSGTRAILLLFYWLKHFEEASFVFIDEFDAFIIQNWLNRFINCLRRKPDLITCNV